MSLTDRLCSQPAGYLNEADWFEQDWQHVFWGENYPRLLAIKHAVDPHGLFVCHHCVGSEEWSPDGNCRVDRAAHDRVSQLKLDDEVAAPVMIAAAALPPWSPPASMPGFWHGFPLNKCPCGELCKPLRRSAGSQAQKKQFFGFFSTKIYNGSSDAWRHWDWSSISTVAVWSAWELPAANWSMLCKAHSAGVRIVLPFRGADFHSNQILNASARHQWITNQVSELAYFGLDGLNYDAEGQYNASKKAALTSLICETQQMQKKYLPDATLSFDLSIAPDNPTVQGGYDYHALSQCLDYIIPMAYDMTGREVGANAPLPAILDGVQRQYPALGIDPSRLVVALPWYSYEFVCSTPTIGSNCSLPAGAKHTTKIWEQSNLQLGYGEALDLHASLGAPLVTYDNISVFKWFDFVNKSTGKRHRVSFDDPETLLTKYKALLEAGVAGVGAWTIAATQRQSIAATAKANRDMWAAVAHALKADDEREPSDVEVTIDWLNPIVETHTAATVEVDVMPFLGRTDFGGLFSGYYAALQNLGAEYVRMAPWFPNSAVVTLELTPSDCTATQPAANWNSTIFDQVMRDFYAAVCGPKANEGECRLSVIQQLSTMPSWMFVNDTNKELLLPFTDTPSSRWNTSGGGAYGTQPTCSDPTSGCLVDETCGQIARYFGRFVGWYTRGGYADECGHWHPSTFHFEMFGLSIWNEDEHRLGPVRYTKCYDAIVAEMAKINPGIVPVGPDIDSAASHHEYSYLTHFLVQDNHSPKQTPPIGSYHWAGHGSNASAEGFFTQWDSRFQQFARKLQTDPSFDHSKTKLILNE